MTRIPFCLILLLTFFSTLNSQAQIPAFPGAEGYGKYTVGGRGGTIYEVTNLNDSGPGSFREACEASGARTVIFKVGGRINITGGTIKITSPNITIAGQTAPGDGIMITREGIDKPTLEIDTDEVIIRHIRFRRSITYQSGNNSDNVWVNSGENIIFDHCSFAWSSDGNLDLADYTDSNYDANNPVPPPAKRIFNITVQYCIFTNSYGGSNKTVLVSRGPTEITFFRNAWLSTATRNPSVSTPAQEAPRWDSYFEHINNFHYDYTNGPSFTNNDTSTDAGIFYVNVIGNKAKENNNSSGVSPTLENTSISSRRWLRAKTTGNDMGIYVENNITPYRPNDTYGEWEIGQNGGGQADRNTLIPENLRSYTINNTPIVTENVTLWHPNDLWANLRTHVGASLPTRDSEDARAVNDVDTGDSTENNSLNTFPIISNGTPYADTDNDGMDDSWEISEFANLDKDGLGDDDNDGYTDLEEYLNQTADGQIPDIPAESVEVTPNTATINVLDTVALSTAFTPVNTSNKSGAWTSSDINIATVETNGLVTAVSEGIATITFTSNSGGFTDSAEITVTNIPAESVEVTPNTATINVPDTVALSTAFTPVNTSNQSGAWTSSDINIATVESNGLVTAVSEGIATITFTSNSGGFTDTAEITVTNIVIPLESVTLSPTDATIEISENSQLIATLVPSDTTDASGTWTSSNDLVATVDENGLVIGIGEGQVDITYTSNNAGLTASASITVIDTFFGTYELYNASTDILMLNIVGDTDINLADEGNEINFRSIPADGDQNIDVESVRVDWTGPSAGTWTESGPIYAGLPNGHVGLNFESYIVEEGTYSFTVTYFSQDGASGNVVATDTFALTFFFSSVPVANAGPDQDICEGETTTLTASGGPNFLWDNGEITSTIEVSPLVTTIYTVSVSDDEGNTDEDSVTVTVHSFPTADAGEDQTICEGESITLTATGGTSYLWSTGEITASIEVSPIIETTYDVEVISNTCSSTDSVIVSVNPSPNVTVNDDLYIYNGDSTTLTANGADTYQWNSGETTNSITITPSETTTYSVTGFSNGCQRTVEVTITVIPELIANAGADVTICSGESVNLNATGGISYSWNSGETEASIDVSPLQTTTYTVTVTDALGGTDIDSVIVTVNETPTVTVSEDLTIMEGESVTLTANGAPTYLWNTGDTTNVISVNPTNTTTYTVTGSSNNCEDTAQVTVTVIPELIANAGADVTICSGESVNLNATGGISYSWNSGETEASIAVSPLQTTTYIVTVTDAIGSTDTDSVIVTVNETPTVTVSEDLTIMEGESVTLTANGAPTYLWNTGDTSNVINVSPTNTTTYTITGSSNNCEDTAQVTVTVIPELIANAGNDVTICSGESITLNASGGVTYTWNTGGTGATPTFSPTVTTTYTVTVTDGLGNSDSDSVTITVNESPNVNVSENITIIEGESTILVASGAETYLWNTGETSSTINVNPSQTTTYTVTGTTNTCSVEAQVTVTIDELFEASAGADERVCDNDTYEVVLTANQGDSYLWNTGETTQSIVVSPISTATYTVTVSQGEQEDTDEVTVYVDPSPNVVIANGESVEILNGDFITLSASGANTYEWNNGATQPNIAVSPSTTTSYEVKGFVGDCYDEKQVTVNVLQPVTADAGEDVYICLDEVATLTATGGDEYEWSTGETTQTILVSPTETTDYTVTVFNALDFDEATVRVDVDTNCNIETTEPPTEELLDFSFHLFPNPAKNIVKLKISETLIDSDVYIYEFTGKLIEHIKILNEDLSPTTTTKINIRAFQPGVYFVKLVNQDRDVTKQLIVK